jgi:glycosyltransferase involved in cell wall biosynthesis
MNREIVFWSSVEAGDFMSSLIQSMRSNGLNVSHKFAVSSKYYRNSKGFFRRILLRFRMYIEYPILLIFNCIFSNRSSIFVITTNTFYAPALGILFSYQRKIIHLVWDLFPDALNSDNFGFFRKGIYKSIKRIVRFTFNNSSANVFLGIKILKYAQNSFGNIPLSCIIPISSPNDSFKGINSSFNSDIDVIEMIYCGNFGAMHDSDTLCHLLSTIELKSPLKINLSFYSSGSGYPDLIKKINAVSNSIFLSINFFPPLDDSDWVETMKRAHISLVTINPGGEKIVMPSKTYSSMAAGHAIVAICARESDLADIVINNNCGWHIPCGGVDEFMSVLNEISSSNNMLKIKRENAYSVGHSLYSPEAISKEWFQLLSNI